MKTYSIKADIKGHRGAPAQTITATGEFADLLAAKAWIEKRLSRDLRFNRVKFLAIVLVEAV